MAIATITRCGSRRYTGSEPDRSLPGQAGPSESAVSVRGSGVFLAAGFDELDVLLLNEAADFLPADRREIGVPSDLGEGVSFRGRIDSDGWLPCAESFSGTTLRWPG